MSKQDNVDTLIHLLADGQFHSGEALGQQLGVSRTAIASYVDTLNQLGLDVYRVTGKGYRLAAPLQLISQQQVAAQLPENLARLVQVQPVVTSTNDVLKQLLSQSAEPGLSVIAEAQTAGRGRRGKRWHSPFGSNLYVSFYWPLNMGLNGAMGLSVVVGTALARCLDQQGIANVSLKWPNDVYVNNQKIAGILVELEGQAGGDGHSIIGVGLNVAMPDSTAQQIDQAWTDLKTVLGKRPDRNHWAAQLVNALYDTLRDYDRDGVSSILSDWQRFDRYYQQPVTLLLGQRTVRGIAQGIDSNGALLVKEKRDGEEKLISYFSGEISVRDGNYSID
ncbi:bifunctional biotin--[acetyl-CoA-carboxylase] ligase/biotin operon repressor BirA [Idiomarina xiamenensis]|uniref:Bifunctional ligase/repressor BirA n=1 Tax=Idiomarina xiamenensis 10-D-4 TaxID=740709 RepID=K2L1Q3_9GAMM|nr:bifunctional biotin--[acetyl-CoA-carboxylase] ligase/biotin operon repressor BirA [Idiomarina xiamenensis]EKE83755.1 biotin--protein ligase [Idiomarina xiamenensis 10-D-4]